MREPLRSGEPRGDAAVWERARQARDARFDGRFYVGVLTTGVYCRPVCPVRPSRPENVRFYPSAAAAAEAGFRPCLRCRPESSPGTPAARGTAATVTRALRLIDEGALDGQSVESLASRLGLGARHLGRLFVRHLGASPKQIAQTRRLHLAMKLLGETDLRITEVAYAAGYGSVRRFNEVVLATYGRPPSRLRGRRNTRAGQSLHLQLSYRPPLHWPQLRDFLALRAIPGLEEVSGDRYRRTIALGRDSGWIQVEPLPGADKLLLTVEFPDVGALATIVARVRRIFDLDADPLTIEGDLATDRRLAGRVAAAPGVRVPGAWDDFELAVRAVLGQAVSVRSARTVTARLVERAGVALARPDRHGGLGLTFPSPKTLAESDLGGLGVPAARATALRGLARAVAGGRVELAGARDLEDFTASLERLPGIGPWTAQYIAMRVGRYPDAFPSGDLGLRRAAAACLLRRHETLGAGELERHAERWRPWRSYAAMYLWSAYSALRCRRSHPPLPNRVWTPRRSLTKVRDS